MAHKGTLKIGSSLFSRKQKMQWAPSDAFSIEPFWSNWSHNWNKLGPANGFSPRWWICWHRVWWWNIFINHLYLYLLKFIELLDQLLIHLLHTLCSPPREQRYVLNIHFHVESGQKMLQFNIQFRIESRIFIQKNYSFKI